MEYKNPVIPQDFSDPDCIRIGDFYYMLASSFNHVPGVPVLKSENLVDWKIIGYVLNRIPFERFHQVCHGDGAWAPSIRMHQGIVYAIIPFPDEGIYIAETKDIESGIWSEPRCLIQGKGLIDPCPIWLEEKCYMVVGFAKSRIGFNSMLGLYEVSTDLMQCISETYTIIFDGHNTQPTIEGPKFYTHGNYIYILAPAGSVKTGWQVALRSKNVYGPYEEKIVMLQNDSKINGPHQGALVDLPDGRNVFLHFQDKGIYGRVVLLEPVEWISDWPIIGSVKDPMLGGTPVASYPYFIDKQSDYHIPASDEFQGDNLSLIWQTPANVDEEFYSMHQGLHLYCQNRNIEKLDQLPNSILTKLTYEYFTVSTKLELHLEHASDTGLCYMGRDYAYISIRRDFDKYYVEIRKGSFDQKEEVLYSSLYPSNSPRLMMQFKMGKYRFGLDGAYIDYWFDAAPGRWIGGKIGLYARGSAGYAKYKYFRVKER